MATTIISRQGGRRYRQFSSAPGWFNAGTEPAGSGPVVAIVPGQGVIALTESGPRIPVTLYANTVTLGGSDSIVSWTWEIDGAVIATVTDDPGTLNTTVTVGPHMVTLTVSDNNLPPKTFTTTMLIAAGMQASSRVLRSRITMG